jgi:hypothetical protein
MGKSFNRKRAMERAEAREHNTRFVKDSTKDSAYCIYLHTLLALHIIDLAEMECEWMVSRKSIAPTPQALAVGVILSKRI